ncbi:mechanosensitive ion channel family protein [Kangiella sp. TOML190]|uniref:mechanosensitive ion channel family protein n=1 Tax=Kangiella sp. TOML190 TaxID=2931351 RepID=UPI00203F8DCC|nr:mechanosensitive ion channel domain-containing protein [Kangiella sp. TOML190]
MLDTEKLKSLLSKPIINISEQASISLWQLLLAVSLLVFSLAICKFVAKFIIGRILSRTNMAEHNIVIVQRIIFIILLIVLVVTTLSILHVPLTAFAFLSGALAIGLGFGAKNILDNFISGWILLSERPLRLGDFVELDETNRGRVIRIGNRSTVIRKTDGSHLIIPNSDLLQTRLINWTYTDDNVRYTFTVGVAYGSDVKFVLKILDNVLEKHSLVLKNPKASVVFSDFADSALVFEIWFWAAVKAERELKVIASDLRFMIERRFREADIVISFPQRDIHLHTDKPLPLHLANDEDNQADETSKDKKLSAEEPRKERRKESSRESSDGDPQKEQKDKEDEPLAELAKAEASLESRDKS